MSTVYVTGSSHVAAILQGIQWHRNASSSPETFTPSGVRSWERGGIEYRFPRFERQWLTRELFADVESGQLKFGLPGAVAEIRDMVGESSVPQSAIWAISSAPTTSSPVLRHPMWKSYTPSVRDDDERTPLTEAVVRAIIRTRQTTMRALHSKLRELGITSIAIEGPPPRSNHWGLPGGVSTETFLELDHLSRVEWRAWCREQDILSIAPPREATDDHGLLREEYGRISPDPETVDRVHGNKKYGALVMDQLHGAIASRRTP